MRAQTITRLDGRNSTPGAMDALTAWCSEQGVDANDVARIEITDDGAAVFKVYLRNSEGKRYHDGHDAAMGSVTVATPSELPEVWR